MSVPQLDAVTVVARNERDSSTFDVLPVGSDTPAVRLFKPYFYDSLHPMEVLVGPRLDQLAGWVTTVGAKGVDGTKHGTVSHHAGSQFQQESWTVEQPGLPPLTGTPHGRGARLRHTTALAVLPFAGGALDLLLDYRIAFEGPGSDGFELSRSKGVHARYALRLHDRRVSLLLALAAVVRYDWLLAPDPKKGLMDLTFPKRS
ncbi:hypothetical protein [Streptacidiphilus melanogenes]|uniref:hypothetical protein n=1 Tax=Streptacidiphilus melanogenes TaxID=411235 RepID=UPI0005AB67AD|nr:hypothetical protein [Streptacidiphilus melanogenes]